MPLYEYECLSCGREFEYLTRADHTPQCPACDGIELRKRLSVFAVGASGVQAASAAIAPCGACGDPRGPGACSMN